MAQFAYVSKDREGRTVKGEVEAADRKAAVNILREKELLVLKLDEAKKKSSLFSFSFMGGKVKVSSEDLVIFARQMATMIGAGLTVVGSLDILAEQTDNVGFKNALLDVKNSVNTGASLSDAMVRHSHIFSALFVNMIRAGESSGTLDVVLDRVASYLEKSNALQQKIKSALVYPAVVTGMAVIITLVLILKVIPVFRDIFAGFDAALPAPTQFLIDLSDAMRKQFLLFVVIIAGMVVLGKWYMSTEKGQFRLDALKLKLPVFGPLLKKVAISKFTRTLSTLIKSGVPILGALEIVAKTSGNVMIEKSIDRVRENVKEGESIADPMAKSGIFPPMVTRMVSVGEKSGELEKMLTKIADFFDEQVDATVDGLTSMIEPLIIAFLGVVVGGIVLCMFLPIFKISTIIKF